MSGVCLVTVCSIQSTSAFDVSVDPKVPRRLFDGAAMILRWRQEGPGIEEDDGSGEANWSAEGILRLACVSPLWRVTPAPLHRFTPRLPN